MIKAIQEGRRFDFGESPTETEHVIKSMLVPPLKNKGRAPHRLGLLNEANVRGVLSSVAQELGQDMVDCWDAGLLRSKTDKFLATSMDGFITLRENDEMLGSMSGPSYEDEDGLFGESESDGADKEPIPVRGGGLLSSLGFGRKADAGQQCDEGEESGANSPGAESDGNHDGSAPDLGASPQPSPNRQRSGDDSSLDTPRSSSERHRSDDDGSEVELSDVSATITLIWST